MPPSLAALPLDVREKAPYLPTAWTGTATATNPLAYEEMSSTGADPRRIRRGRFLSVDPVLGDPHNPQSWNRYTYARNNPIRYTDPDGRCTVDGETHGVIWCFAHTLGFVQTQHEHAQSIRKELDSQGLELIQNGHPLNTSTMSDKQLVATYQQFLEADRAGGLKITTIAPFMTQWGWNNSAAYRQARAQIDQPGTHQTVNGKVPTRQEAVKMIEENGGKVQRIEGAHGPDSVAAEHNFSHINYTTSSGVKATVRIQQ